MFNNEIPSSLSNVRHHFGVFFENVRLLYTLLTRKEEKSIKIRDIKRYSDDLFKANLISEYLHLMIEEAILKFDSLHPANVAVTTPDLEKLDQWISLSINEIDSEVEALMH